MKDAHLSKRQHFKSNQSSIMKMEAAMFDQKGCSKRPINVHSCANTIPTERLRVERYKALVSVLKLLGILFFSTESR